MYCHICGNKIEEGTFIKELEDRLHNQHTCFSCDFWIQKLKEDQECEPHRVAIIDGTHYYIDDEDSKSSFRGFGGDKFEITFNDGTHVVTTNLWCQGTIPEYFRNKFPNNAIFDEGWHWKKIGHCSYLVKK